MPDALLAAVARRLQLPPEALSDLHALLQTPASIDQTDMPLHMRQALQALHTNTHFAMQGQHDRVHTRLGSRPGDPFADVIFGYMFSRILTTVERKLSEMEILETIPDVDAKGLFPQDRHTCMTSHAFLARPGWTIFASPSQVRQPPLSRAELVRPQVFF